MLNTILILFRTIFLVLGGYEQVALENLALRDLFIAAKDQKNYPKKRKDDVQHEGRKCGGFITENQPFTEQPRFRRGLDVIVA